ncbi:S8 family serine peptidase [Paenibacillus sp. GCM10027627]|uniref:S8 family peptidase n=1 Tax=unclassified Paenibacillus TaxID=185978 RepID=UPI00363C8852
MNMIRMFLLNNNRESRCPANRDGNTGRAAKPRGRHGYRLPARGGGARSFAQSARGLTLRALIALLLGSAALGGIAPGAPAPAYAPTAQAAPQGLAAAGAEGALEQPQSWLLKWASPADAHKLRGVEVLHRQSEAAVEVVRPAQGTGEDLEAWLARLRGEPGVSYVHPNGKIKVLGITEASGAAKALSLQPGEQTEGKAEEEVQDGEAGQAGKAAGQPASALQAVQEEHVANDPELAKQPHLVQTGAIKAWETVRDQKELIIALVDTGVDTNHPDLKDNLVPGTNLISPKKPPEDDNGHGTSVAGVLAAKGNNGIGGSGILWNAKLMPIKALDQWGDGTEQHLGEGILYAVRSGAKIVVMSVGLYRYSPYMQDIVQYAENKGVLLVAAAGNDGASLGNKAAVKYPAAYPTVLAVGGLQAGGSPHRSSNPGPELDLMAPWNVYTTALGGGYKQEEGTSMSAPQVAAAAALVLARHPDYKPYQVRELLKGTAKDVGAKGADKASGYGALRIDQAVSAEPVADIHEPNETMGEASAFPVPGEVIGQLEGVKDRDWFVLDAPDNGKLKLQFKALIAPGKAVPVVRVTHVAGGKTQKSEDIKLSTKEMELSVQKGKQHIYVQFASPNAKEPLSFSLTSAFTVLPDKYEPNDQTSHAFKLEPKTGSVKGNFHQTADRDWFSVTFAQDGKLRLTLDADTVRIDSGLSLQREGEQLTLYDENGEGKSEATPLLSVKRGQYLIRVHNAISLEASPVAGSYTLKLEYTPELMDPNEPNDKSYEALLIKPGTEYRGVIHKADDADWFQFRIVKESIVSIGVSGIPAAAPLQLQGYDKRLVSVTTGSSGSKGSLKTAEQVLKPGLYYLKLTSSKPFSSQYYRLKMTAEELVSGFRDIKNHWAKEDIAELSTLNVVKGGGSYRFYPDRNITRAEAVAMIVNAYKPIGGSFSKPRFKDVSGSHWAKESIDKAVEKGWARGYPDGSFKPDDPITRAEMAVMIGYADGVKARMPIAKPFRDVALGEWYTPMVFAMKAEGGLQGVKDNSFLPEGMASRGEFASLLLRYYQG